MSEARPGESSQFVIHSLWRTASRVGEAGAHLGGWSVVKRLEATTSTRVHAVPTEVGRRMPFAEN
ncbi:MAG TPA: hypothetical protein VGS60_13005 [Actinomycetes bacterium]|jgi:hypothetical protein|nr:hypothetical protein [Actinomycetes bacterium]